MAVSFRLSIPDLFFTYGAFSSIYDAINIITKKLGPWICFDNFLSTDACRALQDIFMKVVEAGVEILCYDRKIDLQSIRLRGPVAFNLDPGRLKYID